MFGPSQHILGQQKQLDSGKKYTLNKITVAGEQSFNENTVIAFTGLKKGDQLYIPGEKLSAITKRLWSQNLFSDIAFYVTNIDGDLVDLELYIVELPKLNQLTIEGVRKGKKKEIIENNGLKTGVKITKNLLTTTKNNILKSYRDKGYHNAQVIIQTTLFKDSLGRNNTQNMRILVSQNERVKVAQLDIEGNKELKDGKLKAAMKNTKQKNVFRIFKRSKYTLDKFEEDKLALIEKYKENGFRDARILKDSISWNEDNTLNIDIALEEGNKYYFGDITFLGNTVYTDQQLGRLLGIKKGDTYNGVLLEKRIADETDPDAQDLTNQYQNNGYLFSNINPVEVSAKNDTINFEIRIIEGKPAYFNNISVVGNEKTNDHVIYREIRTKPGELYSKDKIIRTIRELGQLGFFDAEQIKPEIKNPDPNSGTVDVEYSLAERGGSQIELQGGYGGGSFIGTLGLSFNNFSIRNIFNKEAWKPLPMGDGQRLSLRLQSSRTFNTYSFSFTEPWLGGRKPKSLSVLKSVFSCIYKNVSKCSVDQGRFPQLVIRCRFSHSHL